MLGKFNALYLTAQEYKQAMTLNAKYDPAYQPYLEIEILYYHSESAFDAAILNKGQYMTKGNAPTNSLLTDYAKMQEAYFSFDGVRFFVITNTAYSSDPEGRIRFSFRYINKSNYTQGNTAFMVMPFKFDKLTQFYQDNIRDYLGQITPAIKVYRADDFMGSDIVSDTILEQIQKAELIICDITHCNKNVFFEIGYAKALNKDIIFLLEQNKPHEFFDVSHIRRIEYHYEQPEQFRKHLLGTIESIRNNRQ